MRVKVGAVKFEWNEEENSINIKKHGVSFEEALTVFFSTPLLVFHDPDHSETEDRFIVIGFSAANKVLAVVHCENDTGNIVRIISARKATRNEQRKFTGDKV